MCEAVQGGYMPSKFCMEILLLTCWGWVFFSPKVNIYWPEYIYSHVSIPITCQTVLSIFFSKHLSKLNYNKDKCISTADLYTSVYSYIQVYTGEYRSWNHWGHHWTMLKIFCFHHSSWNWIIGCAKGGSVIWWNAVSATLCGPSHFIPELSWAKLLLCLV